MMYYQIGRCNALEGDSEYGLNDFYEIRHVLDVGCVFYRKHCHH